MEDYIEHKVKIKVKKYVTMAFKIFFGILAVIAFALLFGYIIMWLWNWLMPEIFGLTTLTYWQAVGVLVLGKLIFGGLGTGHSKNNRAKSRRSREHARKKMGFSGSTDFSDWKHYDKFWEEEGQMAYRAYIERTQEDKQ